MRSPSRAITKSPSVTPPWLPLLVLAALVHVTAVPVQLLAVQRSVCVHGLPSSQRVAVRYVTTDEGTGVVQLDA